MASCEGFTSRSHLVRLQFSAGQIDRQMDPRPEAAGAARPTAAPLEFLGPGQAHGRELLYCAVVALAGFSAS